MRAPTFIPSVHGFPFANDFSMAGGLFGLSSPLAPSFGLAAGMCWAALDRYAAGRRIPRDLGSPRPGESLYLEFVQRQSNALARLGWDALRRTQEQPDVGIVSSLAARSRRSWRAIRGELSAGRPVLILVLRAEGAFGNPSSNVPVLAYGYQVDRRVGRVTLSVYDPNRPDNDSVRLTFRLGGPRKALDATLAAEPVRGFLPVRYDRPLAGWLGWDMAGDVGRGPAPLGAPAAAWGAGGVLHVMNRTEGTDVVAMKRDRRGRWSVERLPSPAEGVAGEQRLEDLVLAAVPGGPVAFGRTMAGELIELRRGPLGRWRPRNITRRGSIGDGFRIQSTPLPLADRRGRLSVLACREGQLVQYQRGVGGRWTAQNLTARLGLAASYQLVGRPTALSTSDRSRHVIGRGKDGDLIHFRCAPDGRWSARNVTTGLKAGISLRLGGDPIALAWPDPAELAVFAVDDLGGIVQLRWTARAGWRARALLGDTPREAEGGETPRPDGPLVAVAGERDTLHLFARTAAGQLMHAWAARGRAWRMEVLTGSRPTTPDDLCLDEGPCVVRALDGELRVFGRHREDLVLYRWQPGGDWVAESFSRERWGGAVEGIAGAVVPVQGGGGAVVASDVHGAPILVRATRLGLVGTLLRALRAALEATSGSLLDWATAPLRLAKEGVGRARRISKDEEEPEISPLRASFTTALSRLRDADEPPVAEPAPDGAAATASMAEASDTEGVEAAALRRERRRLESDREQLAAEREQLEAARNELARERARWVEELSRDASQGAWSVPDAEGEGAEGSRNRSWLQEEADRLRRAHETLEQRLAATTAEEEALRQDRAAVASQRDSLLDEATRSAAEREQLDAEREAFAREREQVEAQRAEIAREQKRIEAARETLEAERTALAREREQTAEGLRALQAEREASRLEVAGFKAEKESIAAEREQLSSWRAAVEREMEEATRRRTSLDEERAELEAARDRLAAERKELTARRDNGAGRSRPVMGGAGLEREREELAAERRSQERRRKELAASRQAAEREREELVGQRKAFERDRAWLTEAKAALERERAEIALQRQASAAKTDATSGSRQDVERKELDEQRKAFEREREALLSEVQASREEREAMAEARADLDRERAALEEEREALTRERQRLEALASAAGAQPPVAVAPADGTGQDESPEAVAEKIALEIEQAAAAGEARRAALQQPAAKATGPVGSEAAISLASGGNGSGKNARNGKATAAPKDTQPLRPGRSRRTRPALEGLPLYDPDEPVPAPETGDGDATGAEEEAAATSAETEAQRRRREQRAMERILALSDRYTPKLFTPGEEKS